MNKKAIIILISSIFISVTLSFFVLMYYGVFSFEKEEEPINENIEQQVEIIEIDDSPDDREKWLANKAINDDYIGEIVFTSNLVNKPFVQAKSIYNKDGELYHCYEENGSLVSSDVDKMGNDVYIYTNWKDMSYDYNIEGGSIFMDYRNDLGDQNIIIYGHHFSETSGNDVERIKSFTPLEKLLDEENYADNNIVNLKLEDEIRTYELCYVYKFDVNDDFYWDNCQYWRTDYSYDDYNDESNDDYFSNYVDALEEVSLYDTGVSINPYADKTLTLQTCISNHAGELFEILVFKQIDVVSYN